MDSKPYLIVITGKTASGKDTVIKKILENFPQMNKVLTTTSRPPRRGEKEGVDYHFLTRAQFEQKINTRDFIEYVSYGGNLYGTEKTQIIDNLQHDLIWRIDPFRAGQVRESLPPDLFKRVLVIYLTVDGEVVLRRLEKRMVSREEIERRIQEDKKNWQQFKDNYDYVVPNIPGHLDETVNTISKIINDERP